MIYDYNTKNTSFTDFVKKYIDTIGITQSSRNLLIDILRLDNEELIGKYFDRDSIYNTDIKNEERLHIMDTLEHEFKHNIWAFFREFAHVNNSTFMDPTSHIPFVLNDLSFAMIYLYSRGYSFVVAPKVNKYNKDKFTYTPMGATTTFLLLRLYQNKYGEKSEFQSEYDQEFPMIVSSANGFNKYDVFSQKSFLAKINFMSGGIINHDGKIIKDELSFKNHHPSDLISYISHISDIINISSNKSKDDKDIKKITYDFIDFCDCNTMKSDFNPVLLLPSLSYLVKRNEYTNFRFIACSEFPLTKSIDIVKTSYTDPVLVKHILSTFDDEFEYCDASDFVKYLITNDARLDNIRTHKKKIILTY